MTVMRSNLWRRLAMAFAVLLSIVVLFAVFPKAALATDGLSEQEATEQPATESVAAEAPPAAAPPVTSATRNQRNRA